MKMLNLCDIELHWGSLEELENVKESMEIRQNCNFEYVYIGSYFCGRYFLHLVEEHLEIWKEFYEKFKIPFVVVLPIFSQSLLKKGKNALEKLQNSLESFIDYYVVNDLGMLTFLDEQRKSIFIGRLFAKDTRDFRDIKLRKHVNSCAVGNGIFQFLRKECSSLMGYEIDNIYSPEVLLHLQKEDQARVVLHTPYVYQSVGQICCYANLETEKYTGFFSNLPCSHSCSRYYLTYGKNDRELLCMGRAALYKEYVTEQEMRGVDICVWPFDLWEEENENENISAITGI